jgi:glutaredoxin
MLALAGAVLVVAGVASLLVALRLQRKQLDAHAVSVVEGASLGAEPPAAQPPGARATAAKRPIEERRPEPSQNDRVVALQAAEQAAKQRAVAKQQADYEAWAHREATRQMEEDEARARQRNGAAASRTAGAVTVTMYSTRWCKYCKAARGYMQDSQIPFVERDIEQDPSAAAESRRLNPRGSVPTLEVGGRVLVGFDPGRLNAAIAAASR